MANTPDPTKGWLEPSESLYHGPAVLAGGIVARRSEALQGWNPGRERISCGGCRLDANASTTCSL
jgi:hypothetical protein